MTGDVPVDERLSQAAALPPGDPVRVAVEAEVAGGDEAMRAAWLALLEEGEHLRLALRGVDPPADLTARLKDLPQRHWPLRALGRMVAGPRLRWIAVALLVVGAGLWWLDGRARETDGALRHLAALAVADHLETHAFEIEATTADDLAARLAEHVPFAVALPRLEPAFTPVGGRRCKLDGQVVAFTSWRGSAGALTVLQLPAAAFGLPPDVPLCRVRPAGDEVEGEAGTIEALVRGGGGRAWVLVADSQTDLERARRLLATWEPPAESTR